MKNTLKTILQKIRPYISSKRLIVAGIIIIGVGALFAVYRIYHIYRSVTPQSVVVKPTKAPEEKSVYSVLLAGYGGGNHEGTYLTDTLMIIRVDTKTKRATLISLPRDLWVEIPTKTNEGFHEKINAVYQMGIQRSRYPGIEEKYDGKEGAGQLLKEVVSGVVGFPIDSYVTVNFEGFERGVDLIGGVDINVAHTFDDYEYPIEGERDNLCGHEETDLPNLLLTVTVSPREAFPCRYEHLHFDAGQTYMDGATALKFVRSRHSLQDGTDFGRAARQQLFVRAVEDKVFRVGFIPQILPTIEALSPYIRTDITPEEIAMFLEEGVHAKSYTVASFIPTDADYLSPSRSSYGGYILIPNAGVDAWGEIQTAIKSVIAGEAEKSASESGKIAQ